MTEMRWVLSREQVTGTFSEPIDWPDGTTVYARLQHREKGMVPGAWSEIPVVSEIKESPKIQLVRGRQH
jgi:hypothetical protein